MKITLVAKSVLTEAGESLARSGREDQGRGSEAEKLAEIAGRECYDSWGTGRSSSDYHKHILEVGHGSVHGHANFTVRIEDISRNLAIELLRHHVGTNPSQRSTRYCDEGDSPTIQHPLTKKFLTDVDVFDDEVYAQVLLRSEIEAADVAARKAYKLGVDILQKYLIGRGCDRFTARKQSRGAMARHLPNGLDTSIVFTVNVRAARNIIEQRWNGAADAEIRAVGEGLYEILMTDSPMIFGDYESVPSTDGLGTGCKTPYRKI